MTLRGAPYYLAIALLMCIASTGWCTPIHIEDDLSRKVTLSGPAKKVVSLAPSLTEIVFALGAGDRLVGRTARCDYPPDALRKPAIGGYLRADLERVMALNPDLVLATRRGTRKEVAERLESMGIPVFVADSQNVEDVFKLIGTVGLLLGKEREAKDLASRLQRQFKALKELLAKRHRPSTLFVVGIRPLVVAGGKSFVGAMIRQVRGANVAESSFIEYPKFSAEEVLRQDPEVLLVLGKEHMDQNEWHAELRRLGNLAAVRNKRVHRVDGNVVSRPSPRIVEGLTRLAKLLHPDAFKPASPASNPEPSH